MTGASASGGAILKLISSASEFYRTRSNFSEKGALTRAVEGSNLSNPEKANLLSIIASGVNKESLGQEIAKTAAEIASRSADPSTAENPDMAVELAGMIETARNLSALAAVRVDGHEILTGEQVQALKGSIDLALIKVKALLGAEPEMAVTDIQNTRERLTGLIAEYGK